MTEDTPKVKKWERITSQEIAEVDAALAKTNGDRRHAAMALGIELYRLNNLITNRPELSARWAKGTREPVIPGLDTEIDRQDQPIPMSLEQHRAVEAVLRQDKLLQKGWERMGMSEKDRDFLQALQLQYATNLRGSMDLAYGGAAHACTSMLLMLEDVKSKIAEVDANPEKFVRTNMTAQGFEYTVKAAHEFRTELYDRAIRIAGELRKMSKDVAEANKLRLVMMKMAADQQQAAKKAAAGWKPGEKPASATPPVASPSVLAAEKPLEALVDGVTESDNATE